MSNNKLVLFDIDGTIIFHLKTHRFEDQYEFGFKQVFGIDAPFDLAKFNGTVDRQNSWEIVREYGVSRETFLRKFPEYVKVMHEVLSSRGKKQTLYTPIPDALALIKKLHTQKNIFLGVITGNAQRIAKWKLAHTGLLSYFPFGLYGDEAESRAELAGLVFEKAKKELGIVFEASQIVVVGDTVHDIRCGKAIGAVTVGVTTGRHGHKDVLSPEYPDYVVDTLLDARILSLFSLS